MQLNKLFLLHALIFLVATGAANVALGKQNAPAAAPAQGGQAGGGQGGQRAAGPPPPPMRLVSTDIADAKPIAGKFTCAAGADAVSPPLQWIHPPPATQPSPLTLPTM